MKAAVLPFARFPGADPVLGPEMRSTGEVMASAGDFASAFAEGRARRRPAAADRAAARSSACATATRRPSCPSRAALLELGFELVATAGTAHGARPTTASRSQLVEKGDAGRPPRPPPRRRPRHQHARGPQRAHRRLRDPRGRRRRARAVHHDARRRARRGRGDREGARPSRRGRSRRGMPRREPRSVVAVEAIGPYALLRVTRGSLDPGVPGQFFMLEAPGRVLPRPMSLCLAPRGELAFLIDPIGPGTRALAALDARRRDRGVRPARERLPPRRPAAAARRRRDRDRAAAVPLRGARAPAGRARLPQRAPRRGRGARAERRGRDRPGARHRGDAGRPRRARVRPRADARGGARARARRPARLGGADGLRLRRLLRLRGRDRRPSRSGSASKGRCCAPPERERLPRRADRARHGAARSTPS